MKPKLLTGAWNLKDLPTVPKNGLKVFSCFHCGGGSSMGYKLAGFEVLGGVEIDEEMMALYQANHHPRHSFLMGVDKFNVKPDADLPPELFDIDILDGSPPCSVFSMAGSREEKWGKLKKFREGQSEQILDDLFFDYLRTVEKLKPKVVVAENVVGLVAGNARSYVKRILERFGELGYDVQLFQLNAARMGVPQKRARVFFVAKRRDLGFGNLSLNFSEPVVSVKVAWDGLGPQIANQLKGETLRLWNLAKPGQAMSKVENRGSGFNNIKIAWDDVAPTVASSGALYHPLEPRNLSDQEIIRLQTFPDDYDFLPGKVSAKATPRYVCGMSVPPFMMQRIAIEIADQWFKVWGNGQ